MAENISDAVIDASVVLSLLIPDETLPEALTFLRNQITTGRITLHTPTIIDYEVTNALHMAVIRQRFDHKLAQQYLKLYRQLQLKRVLPNLAQILKISHTHSLSAYDASYLELSQRLHLPLYSLDKKLTRLARP